MSEGKGVCQLNMTFCRDKIPEIMAGVHKSFRVHQKREVNVINITKLKVIRLVGGEGHCSRNKGSTEKSSQSGGRGSTNIHNWSKIGELKDLLAGDMFKSHTHFPLQILLQCPAPAPPVLHFCPRQLLRKPMRCEMFLQRRHTNLSSFTLWPPPYKWGCPR